MVDGKVIGVGTAHKKEGDAQKIGMLYVLPEYQGRGAGSMLMNQILEWLNPAVETELTVVSYNQNAIHFYERFGFLRTGIPVATAAGKLSDGTVLPEVHMQLPAVP